MRAHYDPVGKKMGLYLFATPLIVFFFTFDVRSFLTRLCRRCAFFFVPCYFYRQTSINKTALVLRDYMREQLLFFYSLAFSVSFSPHPYQFVSPTMTLMILMFLFFRVLTWRLLVSYQLSFCRLSYVLLEGEWGGGGFQGKCARSFFQKSIIKDRKRKKK